MDKNLKTSLWFVASLCDANAGELTSGAAAALKSLVALLAEDPPLDALAERLPQTATPFDIGALYAFAASQVKDRRRKGAAVLAIGKHLQQNAEAQASSRAAATSSKRGLEVEAPPGLPLASEPPKIPSELHACNSIESPQKLTPPPAPKFEAYVTEAKAAQAAEEAQAVADFVAAQKAKVGAAPRN